MRRFQKISAYILLLPVIAILLHNLVPHHHHDSCISESHEVACALDGENHHHATGEVSDNCTNVHHQENEEENCHFSDIYKIEKQQVYINYFKTVAFIYSDSGQDLISSAEKDIKCETPEQLLFFLRGPPLV